MRIIRCGLTLIVVLIFLAGCNQNTGALSEELMNEEGLISAEMFMLKDSLTYSWKIKEVRGRSTLVIQEGVLGSDISSYEIYEPDHAVLIKRACSLAEEKKREGFQIFSPDAYSQLIIQVDTTLWGDISDMDQLAIVEDLIDNGLILSGNGRCTGSDIANMVSFYAVVFNPEIAMHTILKVLHENALNFPVVIAVEKGNDVKVIYPDNFQGEFSLI